MQRISESTTQTDPTAALEAFRRLSQVVVIRPEPAFPERPIETPFGPAMIRAEGLNALVVTTYQDDGVYAPATQVPLVVNRVDVKCDFYFAKAERGRWVPQSSTYSYLRRVDGKELSWNARDKVEKALTELATTWAKNNAELLREGEGIRLAREIRSWEGRACATLAKLQQELENLQAADAARAAWEASLTS
jgi:hypothetical protein